MEFNPRSIRTRWLWIFLWLPLRCKLRCGSEAEKRAASQVIAIRHAKIRQAKYPVLGADVE
jgi:hypothetical protein